MERARTSAGESVLTRGLRILEAFSADDVSLRVPEIARRAGLPLPTAHRLVHMLTEHGLLDRGRDGSVHLGLRLWQLARRASPLHALREAADPVLTDLSTALRTLQRPAQLGIGLLLDEAVVFVEGLPVGQAVGTSLSGSLPLHASAAGLVLLAHAPAALVRQVSRRPLTAYTPQTIASPEQLRAALADVRRKGFALCRGHVVPGVAGVAAPIRDAGGSVVAALTIMVGTSGAAATVPTVTAAALRLSHRLGSRTGLASAHALLAAVNDVDTDAEGHGLGTGDFS